MKLKSMKFLFIIIMTIGSQLIATAQDDLMNLLDEPETDDFVAATFKGSRIILGHSVEMNHKKSLEFLISHRFGRINSGAHELYGLDNANIRLGLEYGITDAVDVGIGRSSFDKTIDGFLKVRLARQSQSFPFSVVLLNSLAIKTTPREEDDPTIEFNDRLATTNQILLARKFSDSFSFQIMPTYVNRRRVQADQENDIYAIGAGGRVKLTKRLSFNAEYYYRINTPENSPYHNSVSVGFDIETGGHVFQLHFTNSVMTVERAFITETFDDFFDGDIHFGFNISRKFQLGGKKKADW